MKRGSNDREDERTPKYVKRVLERWDAIVLFISAIVAEVLLIIGFDSLGVPAETIALGVLLLVLSLLTYHILGLDTKIGKLAGNATMLEEKGVQHIYGDRKEAFNDINDCISSAKRVFIVNRYFTSFTEKREIRRSLHDCLMREGTQVRVMIYAAEGSHLDVEIETETKKDDVIDWIDQSLASIDKFKKELPLEARNRFECRVLSGHIIYVSMFGTQDKVFATPYLRDLAGDECPTLRCGQTTADVDFFSIYRDEFEKMWELGTEHRA